MRSYPVNLIDLSNRKCIVIGGGAVALRKVEGLLAGNADVTVISPALVEGLAELHAAGKIAVIAREFREEGLDAAWLVIAATDDREVNHAAAAGAMRRGQLVNVVDDPEHSNFIVPAVVRRGELALAICTGGASPALARRLRERLEELIGPEYGDLAALLAELRPQLLARFPTGQPRLHAALQLVDSDLLAVLRSQGVAAARAHAQQMIMSPCVRPDPAEEAATPGILSGASEGSAVEGRSVSATLETPGARLAPGTVYLVGAGPGDPGLITVRGLACLRGAGVVVYDRLIPRALLSEAPHAHWIDVGKQPDRHPVPQEQINEILVAQARLGKTVVRLKGGDPFVFGRGGEEAEALARAGLPFEIVPGVTSAIAAAAYAGIPITHRDAASSFAVFTGHRRSDAGEQAAGPLAASPLAGTSADTLVFLMGMGNLPAIVDDLLAAGRDAATPVAVVSHGTWPQQRTVTGSLHDIVEKVAAANIAAPAAVIAGDVVRLREQLRWFDLPDRRPLLGLRILNTRPASEGTGLTGRLAELGAEVIALPATRIGPPADEGPLDDALHRLAAGSVAAPAYDWIAFTSANAVAAFFERLLSLPTQVTASQTPASQASSAPRYDVRCLAGVRLAAIGPATARALAGYGLVPDLVPDQGTGKHLAAAMPDVAGKRVLLPRSDQALPDLPAGLAARGAQVTEVVAYSVTAAYQPAAYQPAADPEPLALEAVRAGAIDVAIFCSPSALRALATMLGGEPLDRALGGAAIACIGPTTAAAAQEMGLCTPIVPGPGEYTTEGLVAALVEWRLSSAGSAAES